MRDQRTGELACDWCGRPESEQRIEPMVVHSDPMMLCAECRGEEE